MLHLSFLLGLIAICVALTINGAWTQANIGTVALGVLCAVVGALMEARRFEQAKTATENQKQLYMLPARDRSRIMQAGLSMLLAASYVVLGLVLLMLQALAFLGT
jgi:hypothetical protein